MLHSRTLNNRINDIQEKTSNLINKDNQPSFKEPLEKEQRHHELSIWDKRASILPTVRIKSLHKSKF